MRSRPAPCRIWRRRMYAGSLTPCIMSNPWITSTQGSAYKSLKASDRCNLAYYLHEAGWHAANPTGEGRQNLDETVCESSLCCTRTYCICKVSVIVEIKVHEQREEKKKAGVFQGNNVEAPWCFTGEKGFCFSKTLPLRSCISAVSSRGTCGDVFPYLLSFGGRLITVANLCKK